MSQEKSECACGGCGKESLKSSKDGYCMFHAKVTRKSDYIFKLPGTDKIRLSQEFIGTPGGKKAHRVVKSDAAAVPSMCI